jgi:hypothetical protein
MTLPPPRVRLAALLGSFLLLAVSGCVQPPPSDPTGDGPPTDPPASVTPMAYADCRRFLVDVEAPKDDVQALLPDGFEAISGVSVLGDPVAGIDVEFWDCPAPLLNEVPTATPLRILSVWVPVEPRDHAGPLDDSFLLEHYVDKNADPAVAAAFRRAKIPVALAGISFDVTDGVQVAHAAIEVTPEGAAPIRYDTVWQPREPPAHALVYFRNPMRIHALDEGGAHVYFEDAPGEKQQPAYMWPHALRAQGGALGQVGTGAAGLLAGHGVSTVVQGTWKLPS